ncbi:MAG: adenylate/guanylate cyclase domain-containing protein, partial [Thermoleophilaceae bacterium]|nr:adenylate/guanylate cyclase domain-containing protein [Thermoleophilaceae bacterium]
PRRLGGDYLGVDVNVAARVGEAAGAGELLASLQVVEHLEAERFDLGRAKRLRAAGAPSDLRVRRISRL